MTADPTVTLYRLLNAGGGLLYGGISKNPVARFRQHAVAKSWWPEVADAVIEHYGCREEALAAEMSVLIYESPQYNIATIGPWLHNWLSRTGQPPQPLKRERWAVKTEWHPRRGCGARVIITKPAPECAECGARAGKPCEPGCTCGCQPPEVTAPMTFADHMAAYGYDPAPETGRTP